MLEETARKKYKCQGEVTNEVEKASVQKIIDHFTFIRVATDFINYSRSQRKPKLDT